MNVEVEDLVIKSLGTARIESPITPLITPNAADQVYISEEDDVLFDDSPIHMARRNVPIDKLPAFDAAGPRRHIFFDPSKTRAAIVTCGGLCPGLNDVIRGLTVELWHRYGVRKIYGFCNGYQGFIARYGHPVLDLDPEVVSEINERGGTILGSSRGNQDTNEIVDCLERMSINILFIIGGDGTIRGGIDIAQEIARRGLKIAIVGVPKTIDNDIMFVDESFGFQTAFAEATKSIRAAHVEAKGAPNGIGLVKLMGRHSGFIACYASLAMSDANFVLIPEVPFTLEGEKGFLNVLRRRIERRKHAVIVVAEGAGQNLFTEAETDKDASGNVRFRDIGTFLRDQINEYFRTIRMEVNLKYIDPSYVVRSVPANPSDTVYCWRLASNAVHAAMAGKTEVIVGRYHGRFVHIPMQLAIRQQQKVDPNGDLWLSVLESTGQPREFA
jgi:6-phosphofructokinase 1